jgi:hypothetical protein
MNENMDFMRWLSDEFWDDVPSDPMNQKRLVTNYRSSWGSGPCQPDLPNGNCRGDIENIATMGANMIRVYGMTSRFMPVRPPNWEMYIPDLANQENPDIVALNIRHKQFLDECQKQGVYVLIGFYLGDKFWNKNFWDQQFTNPVIKADIEWFSKIYREVAAEVGQHPAVLGFTLNNEIDGEDITWKDPNLAHFSGTSYNESPQK